MSNVFLDCGTHLGQGLREFIARFSMNETWKIHTFEANPVTYEKFVKNYSNMTPWVNHHNKAVGTYDGEITVNLETPPNEDDTGMGTSVIGLDKWNPWGNSANFKIQKQVECIDFSKFIKENFNETDNINCKLDIEGSEYDLLERMIQDGTVKYFKHLSVEWHSRFFNNKQEMEEREKLIIEKIKSLGISLESWR